MVDSAIIREWVVKADEDFRFAEVNLKERDDFFAQICFHFHQSAEKYLKSFIVAYELEFKKIHDLVQLLEICKEKESGFEEIREDCKYLKEFYIDTRYPAHWPTHYAVGESERAYLAAGRVRIFVTELLADFFEWE